MTEKSSVIEEASPPRPVLEGIVDLHVHGSPSVFPRHASDIETVQMNSTAGVVLSVLKAHEGSTVDRAAIAGPQALGGIVLNSAVGGPNADAVEIAGRLGGRIVWMPTISAPAHVAAANSPELALNRDLRLSTVDVVEGGRLVDSWHDVLEVVGQYDMVLASGHLTGTEALILFRAARYHGVRRFLLNHPVMPFLEWNSSLIPDLRTLNVHLEMSIVPDQIVEQLGRSSRDLVDVYPTEMLVFGSDVGHVDHPTLPASLPEWVARLSKRAGDAATEQIMTTNGRRLVLR
jgi:hypothetical protein